MSALATTAARDFCLSNDVEGLSRALQHIDDVNAPVPFDGQPTPIDHFRLLHIACVAGHYDVAKLLLLSGANVNQRNASGRTPLYYACMRHGLARADLIALLLTRGASTDQGTIEYGVVRDIRERILKVSLITLLGVAPLHAVRIPMVEGIVAAS